MPDNPEIKIGTPVWVFDRNRRVYKKDSKGRSVGAPIWREHWRKTAITSETSRSWILDFDGRKIAKALPRQVDLAWSEDEINQECYVQDNRHSISDCVRRCTDFAILKQIAALVGYKEES